MGGVYDRRSGSAALSPREGFAHVVAVHRAFVTALGAAESFGLPSSDQTRSAALNDEWLREAGTVFRDSFLMNGRNLVAFYTAERVQPNSRYALDTDVLLRDFGLPTPKNAAQLACYKGSISAHVVHITAWRDESFRQANPLAGRDWIDWDIHTSDFGDEVLAALADTASKQSAWQPVLKLLLDACSRRRANPTVHWPQDLAGPSLIASLLTKHGL